eukprot:TRINITY_DN9676_c0_g1_i11.p1 TRINITY_DN9676_c0_g1~~TRINITY_DN9676_c0_g1_i11.p1  ORF type:complete len:136 (+),score=24.36 TRINITY_DN9676_c0_g1_i11:106-513(+)
MLLSSLPKLLHLRLHHPRPGPLPGSCLRRDGVPGDYHTCPFILKACGLAWDLEEGIGVHREVVKRGSYEDLFVENGLISMYCRCGEVDSRRKAFDEIPDRDLVSWNSMVGGYAILGKMGEAQGLFDEMLERDVFA